MKIFRIFPAILCLALSPSCSREKTVDPPDNVPAPVFTSFIIEKSNNPGLKDDVACTISGNVITGTCIGIGYGRKVIPTFSGDFESVTVDGEVQESGVSGVDASRFVKYTLWGESGPRSTYELRLVTGNGLPIVTIDTDGTEPTSKDIKLPAQIRICNTPANGIINAPATIKVRGNATAGYPKKPFKIKFTEKATPFGYNSNKDWVLLAEYSDKSLLRTSWMNEVSKAVGMPYTPAYRQVELYLNGDYRGVYVFTDHIEQAKHRIDINDDGFIIQNDNALSDELFYFTTQRQKYNYTFKYPDPDDGEIAPGDENYNYIVDFMNNFETALYSDTFSDAETGYRAYIDPVTFAKWYIVFEVTHNYEPNLYFVMHHKGAKLQMYPAWDGEWSMGLAYRPEAYGGWVRWPDGEPKLDDVFWSRGKYLARLFQDPYFVGLVKTEWEKFKPRISEVKQAMGGIVKKLEDAQEDNFRRWPILNAETHIGIGLVAFDTWKEEVDYTFDVFETRIETIEAYLQSVQ